MATLGLSPREHILIPFKFQNYENHRQIKKKGVISLVKMTGILDKHMIGSFQTCSECNKILSTKKQLMAHEKDVHGSKLSCDMCAFKTARRYKLENHKRARHYGQEKFDCDQCQKSFANKDYLKIHKDVIHEGKFISCDQCDFKTGSSYPLKAHNERVHQKKSFECKSCNTLQSDKAALNFHIKNMCGKTFKCSQCDHKSKTYENLQIHKRNIHDGIRFPCPECDYKATQKANLNIHRQAIHENITHNCLLCDFKASTNRTMRLHNKSKHPCDPKPTTSD